MVIYSQRIAAQLMLKGFVLLELKKSDKCPDRNVFIFKDSQQIKQVLTELTQK